MNGVQPRDVCVSVPFWYRHPYLEIFFEVLHIYGKKNAELSGITMPTAWTLYRALQCPPHELSMALNVKHWNCVLELKFLKYFIKHQFCLWPPTPIYFIKHQFCLWPPTPIYYYWSLRAGRSGDRIPEGVRFSAPVQTGPGAHPASYTMGTDSFQGVKRPERGVDHPPPI